MKTLERRLFPLASVTQENLARLCEALWGWRPCVEWLGERQCLIPECSCRRAVKLEAFCAYTRHVPVYYLPDNFGNSDAALRSHDDLIDIIILLKETPDRHRSQLTAEYFIQRTQDNNRRPPQSDQDRAFNMAAR